MQSLKEFAIYTKKTLTVKDTYSIRRNTFSLGMDERVLVESAGVALADAICHGYRNQRMLFACGPGGKGAIGLSTARHMPQKYDVSVAFIGSPELARNQSNRFNYRLLDGIVEARSFDETGVPELEKEMKKADTIVDAIVGCGMHGRLSSLFSKTITAVNKSGKEVVSIDIPSGIDADTGLPNTAYVKAAQTLTIHKLKQGIVKSKHIGTTIVVDIGIPVTAELFAGPGDIYTATEPRLEHANKYSNGSILIVGGSKEYQGAPNLAAFSASAAMSSLLTGSGYVTVALPEGAGRDFGRAGTQIGARDREWKDPEKVAATVSGIKHDMLVIGPGLVDNDTTDSAVEAMIRSERAKGNAIVVDATAIKVVAKHKALLGRNAILTPHDGEFKNLSGTSLKDSTLEERVRLAISFARAHGFTLVLKGHETVVTDGSILKINRAATPALATMGTGDVLCGMIASYAAVHKNPFESAVAGVYAHSRIGDLLYAEKGYHITAMDVVGRIPDVLKVFDSLRD